MNIKEKLKEVAEDFSTELISGEDMSLRDHQIRDLDRIAFHIELAINSCNNKPVSELEICDLGGGYGFFSVGCAANGFKRSVLVDDFSDPVNLKLGDGQLELNKKKYGVEIYSRDLIKQGI